MLHSTSQTEINGDQKLITEPSKTIVADAQLLSQTTFHDRTARESLRLLETDEFKGLTTAEAEKRLAIFGKNEISGDEGAKWYWILLGQIITPMTAILTLGAALALAHQDFPDAIVLILVIVTNAAIGFQQEFKAEKTMDALRKMASPTARVLRNTTIEFISANETVPGDILLFEEGDVIPADGRIIESFHLEIDEALLTGESVPVQKSPDPVLKKDEAIGDRVNLVYSTTTVTKGRGKAVVHRTGFGTEMGIIAIELEKAGKHQSKGGTGAQKTNLEKSLNVLAYALLALVAVLALIVFAANEFKFSSSSISYAISVVIAVLPEGLTAVVTLTMAFGVRKMAKQKAIVRKRMALEALGTITNICSDKTGTLTQGKMVVTKLYLPGLGFFAVDGAGYRPVGKIYEIKNHDCTAESGTPLDTLKLPSHLAKLIQCGSLCNMSSIKRRGISTEGEKQQLINTAASVKEEITLHQRMVHNLEGTKPEDWESIGDPTEAALQVLGWKVELGKPHLTTESTSSSPYCFKILDEFPFDSTLKRMSVIYRDSKEKQWIFAKGAIESIFSLCIGTLDNGNLVQFSDEDHKSKVLTDVVEKMELMASLGLRVLSLAYREVTSDKTEKWERELAEQQLVFIGLVGIYDPPRQESKPAVSACRVAGISVHMLTGDHPKTAMSIAKEIGILSKNYVGGTDTPHSLVMTAPEFDKLDDATIDNMQSLPLVIARCSPVTKVKMVDALNRRKKIVAMTGDGTNDAPSLKKANVGIAMGMNGSDVSKQASDIVLTDDNFATIVLAVGEGRRIFANIQKFVCHLMSGNIAEIVALIIGLVFRDSIGNSVFPMSPIQILFLNMFTSSPPAMGLGIEPATKEAMIESPRDSKKGVRSLFTNEVLVDIFVYGSVMGGLTLGVWSIILFHPAALAASNGQPIGLNCNSKLTEATANSCDLVFRARAASFVTLTFLILIHAYNCRSLQKSIIWNSEFAGFKAQVSNKVLFWSVLAGAIATILTVYIPWLNDQIFLQNPIDWEWGLIFASCFIFLGFAEAFKAFKRRYFPHKSIVTNDIEMSLLGAN